MAFDTFSPNLGILLPGTGNDAGSWGNYTNTNLGTIIENAISGYIINTFTNVSVTLTIPQGAASTAGNMTIECQGTLGATNVFLFLPQNKKLYFIYNNTSDAQPLNVKTAGGTNTVVIPNGYRTLLVSNGTDVTSAQTYFIGAFAGPVIGNVLGNLTGNVTGNVAGNLTGNVTGNVSGTAGSLQTAHNINGVPFNGTADITISAVAAAGNLTGTALAPTVVNSSLQTVGTLQSPSQIPVGLLTNNFAVNANGLATVATSGSASDINQGTMAQARLPGGVLRQASLGSGVVTVQSGGAPSGGSDGDIFLIY